MIDVNFVNAFRQSIQSAQTVLCVSHTGPDGDAIGSLLGMTKILRQLGKNVTPALPDMAEDALPFLSGIDDIILPPDVAAHYDLIVCLDASDRDRMGKVYREVDHKGIPLIVIDHHVTNTYFGDLHWVEPNCAATCQMVVYLAEALEISLNPQLAQCLLTGLVTDTLCFRTSNTSAAVLEVAMRLMQAGADLAFITEQTLNRRSFRVMQLWGQVLPTLHLEEGVIWTTVSRTQLAAVDADPDRDVNLSGFLVTAAEANVSATFLEKEDEDGLPTVECSFRAKRGYNVGELAFRFGGGGHPPASGCTISGTLDEVTAQVVPELKKIRPPQQGTEGQEGNE